jgi:hypothetical protein
MSEAVGACSTVHTPWKESGDKKTPQLKAHVPLCAQHSVMTSFQLEESGSKTRFKFRCCGVVKDLGQLGQERSCSWSGDPHFCAFDRNGCNNHQLWSGDYVIVDSPLIHVQGKYCSRYKSGGVGKEYARHGHDYHKSCPSGCCFAPAVTREVAFGGHFLMGHILYLKDKLQGVYWDNTALLGPGYANVNGVDIETVTGGLVKMTRLGHWYTTWSMPLGVSIQIASWDAGWWGPYHDVPYLKMKQLPDPSKQSGQCGNNDGKYTSNENPGSVSASKFKVEDKQNLWGEHMKTETGKLEACKAGTTKYNKAMTTCQRGLKDTTSATGKAVLAMCIYDICVLGGSKFVVAAAEKTEEGLKEADDSELPIVFSIEGPFAPASAALAERSNMSGIEDDSEFGDAASFGTTGDDPCGKGKILAMPFSLEENEAAIKILKNQSKSTKMTELVRIGAMHTKGQWRYVALSGGEPLCRFTNFAPGKDKPIDKYAGLCMRVSTGMWEACSGRTALSLLCVKEQDQGAKKKYALSELVGALEAREVCGANHRLAMPRSVEEVAALTKFIGQELTNKDDRAWIGGMAGFYPKAFIWDDGTKLSCGKSNWLSGQPGAGFDATAIEGSETDPKYMCVDKNGKWYNCGSDESKQRRAICEKAPEDKSCPQPGKGGNFASAYLRRLNLMRTAPSADPDKSIAANKTQGVRLGEAEFGKGVHHNGHCWYLGWEYDDCNTVCYSQLGTKVDEAGMMFAAVRYDMCENVAKKLGLKFKPLLDNEQKITSIDGASGCHFFNQKGGKVLIGMNPTFSDPNAPGCCQGGMKDVRSEGKTRAQCNDELSRFWNPFATYSVKDKACIMSSPTAAAPTGPDRHRLCACTVKATGVAPP